MKFIDILHSLYIVWARDRLCSSTKLLVELIWVGWLLKKSETIILFDVIHVFVTKFITIIMELRPLKCIL